jgi:hypothetical protein
MVSPRDSAQGWRSGPGGCSRSIHARHALVQVSGRRRATPRVPELGDSSASPGTTRSSAGTTNYSLGPAIAGRYTTQATPAGAAGGRMRRNRSLLRLAGVPRPERPAAALPAWDGLYGRAGAVASVCQYFCAQGIDRQAPSLKRRRRPSQVVRVKSSLRHEGLPIGSLRRFASSRSPGAAGEGQTSSRIASGQSQRPSR